MISDDELKTIACDVIFSYNQDVDSSVIQETVKNYFEYGPDQSVLASYRANSTYYWQRVQHFVTSAEIQIHFPE